MHVDSAGGLCSSALWSQNMEESNNSLSLSFKLSDSEIIWHLKVWCSQQPGAPSTPAYNKENYTLRNMRWNPIESPEPTPGSCTLMESRPTWRSLASCQFSHKMCSLSPFCLHRFESAESDHCNYPQYSFCQSVLVRDQYYGSTHSLSTCLGVLIAFK